MRVCLAENLEAVRTSESGLRLRVHARNEPARGAMTAVVATGERTAATMAEHAAAIVETSDHSSVRAGSSVQWEAFSAQREALYAQLAPLVRRLIRQYGQDADMRQDLAGEIYCRFCALLDAYDPTRGVPLRPYLIRQLTATTYTYARQQWRAQRRELSWEEESGGRGREAETSLDPTREWIEALSSEQMATALPEALAQLPVRQRKVIIWRYYEQRSFEEIAEILTIQPSTVRSLLRHGLNNLRKKIAPAKAD